MAATDFPQPLILIADDDRAIRKLLNLALVQEDYQVVQVSNGEQVLQDFQRLKPDLVMLDAMMPELNGFDCCRHLRTVFKTDVPILLVTVLDDQTSIDQAFEAGATDFITKPIHWPVLSQRVKQLLSSDRALRQVRCIQEQLIHSNAWESLLRETLIQISHHTPISILFQDSLDLLRNVFNAQHVGIYNKSQSSLQLINSTAGSSENQGILGLLNDLPGVFGEVLQYSEDNQNKNGHADESLKQIAHMLNASALLLAPIYKKNSCWGWLLITRQQEQQWSQADTSRLIDLTRLIELVLSQPS